MSIAVGEGTVHYMGEESTISVNLLYLYKSALCPCMEYCCHMWAGTPSCHLELLGKLQKQICRTVGPSLAASLEPVAHHRNVASLKLVSAFF